MREISKKQIAAIAGGDLLEPLVNIYIQLQNVFTGPPAPAPLCPPGTVLTATTFTNVATTYTAGVSLTGPSGSVSFTPTPSQSVTCVLTPAPPSGYEGGYGGSSGGGTSPQSEPVTHAAERVAQILY